MSTEGTPATIKDLPIGWVIRRADGHSGKRIPDASYDLYIQRMPVDEDMVMGLEEGKVPFVTADGELFLVPGDDVIALVPAEPAIPQAFTDAFDDEEVEA